VLVPVAAADFVESAVVEARPGTPVRRTVAPIAAILVVPLLVGFGLQVRSLVDPDVRSIQEANRETAAWISATCGRIAGTISTGSPGCSGLSMTLYSSARCFTRSEPISPRIGAKGWPLPPAW